MSRPKTIGVKNAPPNKILKFDAKKKEEYIQLLREGGRRHASARAIRIDPGTVVNHRREDPDFDEACNLAELEADDEVEDALRMAAISGNVTAALAWLYSRRPERWSDTRHTEVKGQVQIDWQAEARANGIDPAALKKQIVESVRAQMVEPGDRGSDKGSAARKSKPGGR